MPEVSLVAILDGYKEGDSMKRAIDETARRRELQLRAQCLLVERHSRMRS